MRTKLLLSRAACALALLAPQTLALAAETHRFTPKVGYPTFAKRPPVLRIKPGDTVETSTLWGEWYERAGGAWPGEVGPFHVGGAAPATRSSSASCVSGPTATRPSPHTRRVSARSPATSTRPCSRPVPARRFVWRLDRARGTGTLDLPGSRLKRIEVELSPMLGRVAVAPPGEQSWGGLWPGEFGGNMDASDVREGATVYLPVFHEGALFYFGDGHALQGDGEVCGSGLETSMDVTFHFELQKGKRIRWPRIENDEYIMATGSVRPLMDAFRIAQIELIDWLVADYGSTSGGDPGRLAGGHDARGECVDRIHGGGEVPEEVLRGPPRFKLSLG